MKRNAEEKSKHVYQAPETVCLELLYESCCMQATSNIEVTIEVEDFGIGTEQDDDWM